MNADKSVVNLSRAIMLALGVGMTSTVYSAQPAPAGVVRPGDIQPELPVLGELPESEIDVETKKPVIAEKRAPYGAKIHVKQINITGNTVFTSEELNEITAPYVNRVVFNSELEDVRIALTRKYIDQGFINSGAVMPDQKVVDGVVQMVIIEGRLTSMDIIGNDHLDSSYVEERLKLGAGTPLNVNRLQEQIQIMLESPVIDTINSALRPGERPGEASLTSVINEKSRFQVAPVIDNHLSPTLGEARLLIPVSVNDLTGHGDVLNVSLGVSEGLTDGNIHWSIPLNVQDTNFSIFANYSDSEVVNGSFKDLEIKNQAQTLGFRVSHPFYRTSRSKFSMSLGMDLRQSESELLGVGFAFTPGVPVDGKVQATIIRFSQDWSSRGTTQVFAARSQFSMGIDAHDATINAGALPSGEFSAWLGQFQWARLLGDDWGQIIFRTNVQLTTDPLFAMEQYSVGGAFSVRGYQENQVVRDNGYDVSLEYRYPLIKDGSGRSVLTLAPFIDAGGSNNSALDNGSAPDFISSVGVGLRWDPTTKIHAQIYWGHTNQDFVNDVDSLQDDGIHFLLNANLLEWQ